MQKSSLLKEVQALADRAHKPDGHSVFALIDGALERSALKRAKGFAPTCSVVPTGGVVASADLSVLPFLIELPAPDAGHGNRLTTELVAWAVERSAVTWLESALQMSSLAAQLALRMEAELEQKLAVVLRFADARVLPVLSDTLVLEQRGSFFSCATNWWYVSRQGELRALPLQREQGATLLPFEPPLRLTAIQEQQLIDAAEPDAVMQILRNHDAEALDQVSPSERYQFIQSCIARARIWSVETPSDLAVFCMVALAHGLAFDEMPYWNAALTQIREGSVTLIQIVQQQAGQT